ncbi:MAG TPA: protein kinase [Tepidisphaeraceae bacterium]|nr:protein kinase [Tepidisphaeraceae bacterium]
MEQDSVRKHFEDLVELPQADRRIALDALTESAPAVARRVRELLDAHDRAGAFLQSPIASLEPLLRDTTRPEHAGEPVGRYRLISRLGEGSFSVVWLARQTEPFERDVALKLLKPGLDVHTIAKRFDAERDALARLEHPNICRIYDAGIHASGRPYFVMEHVPGQPITAYALGRRLDHRTVAQLVADTLRAVEHAHRHAIVHRDLKPANVLVSEVDAAHVVKVIDFGIARMIAPDRDAPQTLSLIPTGSPAYMSPEQFQPGGVVTAQSDVFAVGRILLELLAGRRVSHHEPASQVERLLAGRGVDRDLRNIVRQATEQQPEDRFNSAAEFSQALDRYLKGEPVAVRRRRPTGRPSAAKIAGVAIATFILAALAIFLLFRGSRESDRPGNLERLAGSAVVTPADAVFPAPRPMQLLWKRPPLASGGWNSLVSAGSSHVLYGVSYERYLEVIDADTGTTTQRLRPDDRLAIRCALSAAGNRLAVATMEPGGAGQRIIILDAQTLGETGRFDIPGAIYAFDFVDAAGDVVAISLKLESESNVSFFESKTGRLIARGPVWRGEFAPTYLLATGDDQTVVCNDKSATVIRINADDGKTVTAYREAAANLISVAIDRTQGKLLICGGYETALFDLSSEKILGRFQTTDVVTSASLTAGGTVVVVGTNRHQLVGFDAATARPAWVLDTPLDPSFLSNPVFRVENGVVLMISMDGSIHAGQLPTN